MRTVIALFLVGLAAATGRAERPYAFRAELETVHEPDMRDVSLTAAADEFAFGDGTVVTVPADADEVLQNAARDFADYLFTSMGVSARVEKKAEGKAKAKVRGGQWRDADFSVQPSTFNLQLEPDLLPRQYRVKVAKDGVTVVAADGKTAAQALYHLEDLMNLRRAPFLTVGEETRRMRIATRMVHSGWGMDLVPEKYMARMAHHGYDSLVVYVKRVGKTKSCEAFADVNALIRQAARHGLGVWLYTSVKAYVHPDDPGAQKVFDETYGAIAKAYPEANGIVLVGESCAFPSKDERTCADPFDVKQARGDTRPAPGWFPCRDYPDWLRCVETAVRRDAPGMKVVFWTYNWAEDRTPEVPAERLRLIDSLPAEGTILQSTFEMPEMCTFPNGYSVRVSDYSITCPGPGENFVAEATRARARGLELFTMCNTGGHTWDFGTAPYQPVPFQWAKRNRALVAAQEKWGLAGLMESHHYGWYPSVVSELAKEAFTEGGLPFDRHIRAIAARDFGERHADEVVGLWRTWSAHAANQPPTLGNQYGPFRIGPAYPFNFGGQPIGDDDMPHETASAHKFAGMTHLNYTVPLWGEEMYDSTNVQKQVELLRPAASDYLAGARRLREMAAALPKRQACKAVRLAGLAEYLGRTLLTTVHLQLGALAWEKKDWKSLLEIGRAERANAEATLPLVDADSSLGFECSMEYVGGRRQIEWKIARLDERLADYARKLSAGEALTPVETLTPEAHEPLRLVADGKCNFAIVGRFKAERAVRGPEGQSLDEARRLSVNSAAAILAENFQKCCGTRPQVLEEDDPRVEKCPLVIALGETKWSEALGVDPAKLPREGFEVRTFGKGVVIVGHDWTSDDAYDQFNWRCKRMSCNGTEWGAEDFADRILGSRRYSPFGKGLWCDYPKVTNLTVPPTAYRDQARIWFRRPRGNGWRSSTSTDFFCGEMPDPVSLGEAHPDRIEDIFFRDAAGKLWYDPKVYLGNFLDVTNPKLADILVEDYKTYYAQNGTGTYWKATWAPSSRYLWFGQVDRGLDMRTPRALKYVRPDALSYEKMSEIYGHFSDYLARKLETALPGKTYVTFAYNSYLRAPKTVDRFPDNMQVLCCVGSPALTWSEPYMARVRATYAEWNRLTAPDKKCAPYLYLLNYSKEADAIPGLMHGYCIGEFLTRCAPELDPHIIYPCFGRLAEFDPLAGYLLYRGLWNPAYDREAALGDFLERMLGAESGRTFHEAYRILFARWRDGYIPGFNKGTFVGKGFRSIPPVQYRPLYLDMLTPESMDRMEALFDAAERTLGDDPLRKRRFAELVDRHRKTFDRARKYQAMKLATITIGQEPTALPPFRKAFMGEPYDVAGCEAKMSWSDEGVRVTATLPAPYKVGTAGMDACGAGRHGGLFTGDTVEVFLLAGDPAENLYQFVLASNGEFEDYHKQVALERPTDPKWVAKGAKHSVVCNEKGWSCELTVPWSAFYDARPKSGDKWRVNVIATRKLPEEQEISISPTLGNNYFMELYATAVFGD